jgi:hypothetical protein
MNATSTAVKAARAHTRMKDILDHSAERPWMIWVAAAILISPFILLLALVVSGF